MERTGHRSLDGVRHYKRTSDEQREALSDILNSKRPCRGTNTSATTCTTPCQFATSQASAFSGLTQRMQLPPTTTNTQENAIPTAFYFNSCSSVNINITTVVTTKSSSRIVCILCHQLQLYSWWQQYLKKYSTSGINLAWQLHENMPLEDGFYM